SPSRFDYTQFDGNAQGFRILTKLQFLDDLCGLNLTFSTLAATLKYPNAGAKEDSPVHKHKHGVFTTEKKYLERIAVKCGMVSEHDEIVRHPLSYLMEAADTICYMTMDVEDGCSKRSWISFEDIQNEFNGVDEKIKESLPFLHSLDGRAKGQRFKKAVVDMRTQLLAYLIDKTIANFVSNINKIEAGTYKGALGDEGELVYDDAEKVGRHMMNITKKFILSQREIHSLEIAGDAILKGIMDCLVGLLFNNRKQYRERGKNFISRSIFLTTLQEHLIASGLGNEGKDDIYFKEIATPTQKAEDVYEDFDVYDLSVEERLRIIRDFVAGMTDKFALNFYQKLSGQKVS
ncbi:MAG: dNTP triphosphohydrolase, partial [Aeriscardovia sp.]|nr:dNTP triphosphohydrolase [Aeriscardovia sp.]